MEHTPSEKEIAAFFSLLSVETRIHIIRLLGVKPLCVNAIAQQLGMTQSAVSQHLRVLRNVRLVEGEKRGYFVHYRVSFDTLEPWQKKVLHLLNLTPPSEEIDNSAMCCGEGTQGKAYECNH
jgi:DNA-binding transcriptional ArsR family regulator